MSALRVSLFASFCIGTGWSACSDSEMRTLYYDAKDPELIDDVKFQVKYLKCCPTDPVEIDGEMRTPYEAAERAADEMHEWAMFSYFQYEVDLEAMGCQYDTDGSKFYDDAEDSGSTVPAASGACACLGTNDRIPAEHTEYTQTDYGTSCDSAWDLSYNYCKGKKARRKGRECWCGQPFCYVDASCSTAFKSRLFPSVPDLYYSYSTCVGHEAGLAIQQCLDGDLEETKEELVDTEKVFWADNRGSMHPRDFYLDGDYKLSEGEKWESGGAAWPSWTNCYVVSCAMEWESGTLRWLQESSVPDAALDDAELRSANCQIVYRHDGVTVRKVSVPAGRIAHVKCYKSENNGYVQLKAFNPNI